ncbi:MAG: Fic family protein [Pyrinomonadaceae bacterium]
MKTFEQFERQISSVPLTSSWYLADLGESLGKQHLFTDQSPQKLNVLRENAIIESSISSNRIEGVEIDNKRIGTVVFGNAVLHDRSEEEVRGYRDALQLIHEKGKDRRLTEGLIKELHYLSRAKSGDAGQYKTQQNDIIEKYPDGRSRVRFSPVLPEETSGYIIKLVEMWHRNLDEKWVHPLIALAAFNLDFLCIHPFRDGNGRVSRLLFLLLSYQLGYEVGRYISFEKLIEENKERYYETLYLSSVGWHDGKHDYWHLINYSLHILKDSYKIFEDRASRVISPRGEKTELIEAAIASLPDEFRIADIERRVPAGVDMIRKVLRDMKNKNLIEAISTGRNATWRKLGNNEIN